MKLGFDVPDPVLQEVVASKPGVIEYILNHFKKKVYIHTYMYTVYLIMQFFKLITRILLFYLHR